MIETVLNNPIAAAGAPIVIILVLLGVRDVGPRRALRYEAIRTVIWRLADSVAKRYGRPLVRDKTGHGEGIATVEAGRVELARALWNEGYRWNPISTAKYRTVDGDRQWSVLSVAWRESVSAADQHHVYVFENSDGTLEIHGHKEASVTEIADHDGGDELVPGDPDGRLADVVERLEE